MRLVFSRKAMAAFARDLRKASWGAASATSGVGLYLHLGLLGVLLGGLAWLVPQVLALVVDSLVGE